MAAKTLTSLYMLLVAGTILMTIVFPAHAQVQTTTTAQPGTETKRSSFNPAKLSISQETTSS